MPSCVFCAIVRGELPAEIIERSEHTLAFLDTRPLFHGHVLVVPRAHHVTLAELPAALVPEVFAAAQRVCRAVEVGLDAQGTFVAMNNRVSQSVPHLHVHVVPRTKGDGLKGFFWPRHPYEGDAQRAAVAERIRAALDR
jgi:histidine triad (HIT) family protein